MSVVKCFSYSCSRFSVVTSSVWIWMCVGCVSLLFVSFNVSTALKDIVFLVPCFLFMCDEHRWRAHHIVFLLTYWQDSIRVLLKSPIYFTKDFLSIKSRCRCHLSSRLLVSNENDWAACGTKSHTHSTPFLKDSWQNSTNIHWKQSTRLNSACCWFDDTKMHYLKNSANQITV